MDRFTRTADIIKAYYSYKQTADSATFVKKVCSFFDFIKDESLSDADLNLLLFLANEAGIPQYYDLLKSKFTNAEIGDESINSLTMSALFHDAISTLFFCQYLILNFPHRVCTYENIDLLTIAHCFLIRYAHTVRLFYCFTDRGKAFLISHRL